MRTVLFVSVAAACWLGGAPPASAAESDSHTVTVQVTAINEIAVSGGNVTLTINSTIPITLAMIITPPSVIIHRATRSRRLALRNKALLIVTIRYIPCTLNAGRVGTERKPCPTGQRP